MTEGGKEFLALWDKVFVVGGLVSGGLLLPNMLQSGFRLFSKVAFSAKGELLSMLYHALQKSKVLARYVKHPFEIIVDFRYLLHGHLKRIMDLLTALGVYILREVRDGEVIFHLGYRDVVFRSGRLAEVKQGIREIWVEGKNGLDGYLHVKYIRYRGSNFGLKYIEGTVKTTKKMVRQEEPMSCSASCALQIGKDHGVIWAERKMRELIGTTDEGTFHADIVTGIKAILEGKKKIFIDGGDFENGLADSEGVLKGFFRKKPRKTLVIVSLAVDELSPGHSVIVDKIVNDIVYIRDPTDIHGGVGPRRSGKIGDSNFGVKAQMYLHDFLLHWKKGSYEYIVIKEL